MLTRELHVRLMKTQDMCYSKESFSAAWETSTGYFPVKHALQYSPQAVASRKPSLSSSTVKKSKLSAPMNVQISWMLRLCAMSFCKPPMSTPM